MDGKKARRIAEFMLCSKLRLSCLVMIALMAVSAIVRPSCSCAAGFYWLCCALKACYCLSWFVWAYFFTRQLWPGYDDSIGWFRKKEKPNPPSGFSREDLIARLI